MRTCDLIESSIEWSEDFFPDWLLLCMRCWCFALQPSLSVSYSLSTFLCLSVVLLLLSSSALPRSLPLPLHLVPQLLHYCLPIFLALSPSPHVLPFHPFHPFHFRIYLLHLPPPSVSTILPPHILSILHSLQVM